VKWTFLRKPEQNFSLLFFSSRNSNFCDQNVPLYLNGNRKINALTTDFSYFAYSHYFSLCCVLTLVRNYILQFMSFLQIAQRKSSQGIVQTKSKTESNFVQTKYYHVDFINIDTSFWKICIWCLPLNFQQKLYNLSLMYDFLWMCAGSW